MSRSSTDAERCSLLRPAGLVLLALLPASAALAQSRGERIELLEQRVAVVERQLANQGLLEMAQQLAALEAEQRRLRGELEELRHALEAAQGRQREQYLDLDQRLRELDARVAEAATAAPEALYQQAVALLRDGRYDESEAALRAFLVDHPDHARAANAWYWIGEVHYLRREHPAARAAFERVLREYPGSPVAGEAAARLARMAAEGR